MTDCGVDFGAALSRRLAAVAGHDRPPGMDLCEYPPAFFMEGGKGAHVGAIPSTENRSAGAYIMWQLRNVQDGDRIAFEVVP